MSDKTLEFIGHILGKDKDYTDIFGDFLNQELQKQPQKVAQTLRWCMHFMEDGRYDRFSLFATILHFLVLSEWGRKEATVRGLLQYCGDPVDKVLGKEKVREILKWSEMERSDQVRIDMWQSNRIRTHEWTLHLELKLPE